MLDLVIALAKILCGIDVIQEEQTGGAVARLDEVISIGGCQPAGLPGAQDIQLLCSRLCSSALVSLLGRANL